jgi:hypothetical protein
MRRGRRRTRGRGRRVGTLTRMRSKFASSRRRSFLSFLFSSPLSFVLSSPLFHPYHLVSTLPQFRSVCIAPTPLSTFSSLRRSFFAKIALEGAPFAPVDTPTRYSIPFFCIAHRFFHLCVRFRRCREEKVAEEKDCRLHRKTTTAERGKQSSREADRSALFDAKERKRKQIERFKPSSVQALLPTSPPPNYPPAAD